MRQFQYADLVGRTVDGTVAPGRTRMIHLG